jgi:HK97 family phage major capsid protein
MPPATDALIARLSSESHERTQFIDGLVEQANAEGRDLSEQEMELLTRTRERLSSLASQLDPLRDATRIARESAERTAQIAAEAGRALATGAGGPVEYRSAGEFVMDVWQAGLGVGEAVERLALYTRAASHQTTADNPGLLPEQILGPIVSAVDAARPLVTAFGPRNLPGGSWSRPKVTQHASVAKQAGEKTELASRKMTITKLPVAPDTFGGYVNVSRQDIDWSQPAIMDLIIADLAAQYAIETENEFADDLIAAATAQTALPTAPTAAQVSAALWAAAGVVYGAVKGQGGLVLGVSPKNLGLIGPLFAPVNPTNSQSSGFNAAAFGQGVMGAVSGISVVMSAGLADTDILVASTAAAEVYEDRIGPLQVVEPSVLGVQVAYAGYFADLTITAGGLVKIPVTP